MGCFQDILYTHRSRDNFDKHNEAADGPRAVGNITQAYLLGFYVTWPVSNSGKTGRHIHRSRANFDGKQNEAARLEL